MLLVDVLVKERVVKKPVAKGESKIVDVLYEVVLPYKGPH
jgi:hypothetical protein